MSDLYSGFNFVISYMQRMESSSNQYRNVIDAHTSDIIAGARQFYLLTELRRLVREKLQYRDNAHLHFPAMPQVGDKSLLHRGGRDSEPLKTVSIDV